MTLETEVLVVGAGPAGLSAALHASLAGARVTIVDEYARPGGQYFKQPPSSFKVSERPSVTRDYRLGREFLARIEERAIQVLTDTLVWGAYEPGILEVYREGECQRIRAERIVVAAGAYDRPVAFPGWTLPGVITAGAAQTMVKSQWVLPGQRVLMVGAGPFQLPVAAQLAKSGARVVGVLEATRFREWMGLATTAWRSPGKIREAAGYWNVLRRAKVPRAFGWTILEARGRGQVEEAVITRVDESWKPVHGTSRVVKVDTVCIGFGFLPSLQLPRLLGCDSYWDPDLSAWFTFRDADQRTSVPSVFIAGEIGGIGGHDVAIEEGAIAGLKAVVDLGRLSARESEVRLRGARARLSRHRQFARSFNHTFAFRPGINDLIRDDTILCRCEEVTAGEVVSTVREWGASLSTLKRLTRTGMGSCQGRICGTLVAQVVARESGRSVEQLGVDTPRPPIKPIPLRALADIG